MVFPQQVHRAAMVSVFLLTLTAFIIIFVSVGGFVGQAPVRKVSITILCPDLLRVPSEQ